jgi:hypothetical protein
MKRPVFYSDQSVNVFNITFQCMDIIVIFVSFQFVSLIIVERYEMKFPSLFIFCQCGFSLTPVFIELWLVSLHDFVPEWLLFKIHTKFI